MTNYETKQARMKLAIVILSCVSLLLITLMLVAIFSLYDSPGPSADRIEGVWHCEALDLTIDADSGTNSHLTQNNTAIPVLHGELRDGWDLTIHAAEEMPLQNGKTAYRYGEQLLYFPYQTILDDQLFVLDESGENYTFIRID